MVGYMIGDELFCEACAWDAAEEWPHRGRDPYGDLIFPSVDDPHGKTCACCGEEV